MRKQQTPRGRKVREAFIFSAIILTSLSARASPRKPLYPLEMGHAFSSLSSAEQRMNNPMKADLFLSSARKLYLDCGAQAESWTLEQAIAYALEDQE